jgi:putative hydrolase of the HAD superfamily
VTAPRGLLLDFGSVMSVSLFERQRDNEQQLGLPAGSLAWCGPFAPETDDLWRTMQRDEITERDYWAQRAREVGNLVGEPDWDAKTLFTRLRQGNPEAVVRPEMNRLILAARSQGILLGVLSNELDLFYGADFRKRIPVLAHFGFVIDATYSGVLKPDPRAYGQAVQEMGLAAGEILFVDDQFRNIAGAAQYGLQTQFFDLRDVPGTLAAIATRLRLTIN